jgi:hypothetical protein
VLSSVENVAYNARQVLCIEEKRRLAALLAKQIPDNASLFINIGTTTEEVAKALHRHRGLRVITNNLHVADMMCDYPDCEVIVLGGVLRKRDRGITGEATVQLIRQFKVDTASSAFPASKTTACCAITTIVKYAPRKPSSSNRARCCWRQTIPSSAARHWWNWAICRRCMPVYRQAGAAGNGSGDCRSRHPAVCGGLRPANKTPAPAALLPYTLCCLVGAPWPGFSRRFCWQR